MDNCSVEMALIGVYAALNVFALATFSYGDGTNFSLKRREGVTVIWSGSSPFT